MVIQPILKRRSVREYKTDFVPEEYLLEIIKAAQFAPTAHNNHAVEFLVVKDPELKNKLFEIVSQDFIKQAPVLLIPLVDKEKTVLPIQDLAIASAHIFLQATALGLGTVWKNLTAEWATGVRQILNIPDNYQMVNIIPIGYPFKELLAHTDNEYDPAKIHFEKFVV